MSKFFITNDKRIASQEKNNILDSKFELSCIFEEESFYAYSTKKLCIDNCNYVTDHSDLLIATGTLLHKERILCDNVLYSSIDIKSFRNDSVGQYAVIQKKDNNLIVFGDEIGVYDIFYYNKNGTFVVSNSLYDMALVLEDVLSVNEYNLIERCLLSGVLGGETFYYEINRLSGHEHLSINLDKNVFSVIKEDIEFPLLSSMSTSEIVHECAHRLKEKARIVVKNYGHPDIFMTGGLDARISLATYLGIGAKPTLNYGIGNSIITNTKKEDLLFDKEFMSRYQLNLHTGSWETPNPVDKDWSELVKEYGFFIHIYGGTRSVIDMLMCLSENVSTFGYGGELYRNLPWIETMNRSYFTVEQFVDEYYAPSGLLSSIKNSGEFRDHILKKMKWVCEKYGLSQNKIRKEDNVFFLLEYRKYADTRMLNFLNLFKYSNLLLMEKDIVQYCRINTDIMKKSKFMINVINELYPDVLEVPVFSHCMLRKYDKSRLELGEPYNPNETIIYKYYRKYKHYIPYFMLILLKKMLSNKKKEQKQLEKIIQDALKGDTYVKMSPIVDLRNLLIYVQYRFVLDFIHSHR